MSSNDNDILYIGIPDLARMVRPSARCLLGDAVVVRRFHAVEVPLDPIVMQRDFDARKDVASLGLEEVEEKGVYDTIIRLQGSATALTVQSMLKG